MKEIGLSPCQGHTAENARENSCRMGRKSLHVNRKSVPQGRLNVIECSPGRQSWVGFECRKSPAGTAENHQETLVLGKLSVVPTGLYGLSCTDPGLSSWATLSRPCGTESKTSRFSRIRSSAEAGAKAQIVVASTARSGRRMARTGLRMMPTFPSSPLKFRTAGFPQYGFKAGVSAGAFPRMAPTCRALSVCFLPSCPPLQA